jgi:transcriptional regulator with XRE-family HTH domain
MDKRERFGANLRRARQAKGLSQEELGFLCKLHRTAVSKHELGEREPLLGTAVKLAAVLEVSPEALCAGVGWLPDKQRFTVEPPAAARRD